MESELQQGSRAEAPVDRRAHNKGLVWGLIGGLLATVVIDLITVAVLPLMGLPAAGGFMVIGDTAAVFFALLGLDVAGGAPLGLAFHYGIGLVLGALFGAAVTRIKALRLSSVKKAVGLGVLYTELIAVPILVLPPILLEWGAGETVWWFGFSFIMHGIWGIVLGLVVRYGLRRGVAAGQG
jgi:hypothetical protein